MVTELLLAVMMITIVSSTQAVHHCWHTEVVIFGFRVSRVGIAKQKYKPWQLILPR